MVCLMTAGNVFAQGGRRNDDRDHVQLTRLFTLTVEEHAAIAPGGVNTVTATCPAGYILTGGSCTTRSCCASSAPESRPDGANGWYCYGYSRETSWQNIWAYAVCSRVQ